MEVTSSFWIKYCFLTFLTICFLILRWRFLSKTLKLRIDIMQNILLKFLSFFIEFIKREPVLFMKLRFIILDCSDFQFFRNLFDIFWNIIFLLHFKIYFQISFWCSWFFWNWTWFLKQLYLTKLMNTLFLRKYNQIFRINKLLFWILRFFD